MKVCIPRRRKVLQAFLLVFCSFVSLLPPTVYAQVQAKDLETFRRFETAFTLLSERGKVAFVAEGTPYQPELTAEQTASLEKALTAIPKDAQGQVADFDAVVVEVARAYDYEARRLPKGRQTSPHVFLLTKRYSNPDDLPYITLEEAADSLKNIQIATRNLVNPQVFDVRPPTTLMSLYRSLTPEQQEIARLDPNRGGGLPIGQLNREQQQQVWACMTDIYFMSLNMFRRLEVRLRGCQNPETAFHRFDFQGVRVFGYTGPIGLTRGHVYHVVLSHGFRTGPGGGIGFTGPRYLIEHSKENKLARTLPDPDAPIPGAPVRPLVLPLACATTLNSFTEVLNRRTAASFIAAVESSLVAKPISVFGAERGEAKDVLEAACAVYGLQLRPFLLREAGGERQGYRISLPVPKVLDRFEDMPGEIHRLLLAALTRIPAGRFDGALKALAEQPQMKLPPASSPSRQMLDKLQGRKEALKRIHTTSLARLRAMVEPKIPADSEIRLPIRESGDDIKCLVAVTNLATLGSLLGELMQQPIPNCIAEFRNVRLFLEIEDKGDRFSIGYGVRHMDRSQVGANTSIEKSQLK